MIMKRQPILVLFLVVGLVFTLASCSKQEMKKDEMKGEMKKEEMKKEEMMEKSLYDRLGGEAALKAVVHQFILNVSADELINKRFARTDLAALEAKLVDQIGQASGGPQVYKGKDMKTAHRGMGISTEEFNALVGDLVKALDQFKVPEKEKNELLAVLGPMQKDIVEKP
jgi:hemoglobin